MENSHVAKVPSPVVSEIIGFLDMDSIKRCREVCRKLKQVVDGKVLIPGDTYGILGKVYLDPRNRLCIKHIEVNPSWQKKFSTLGNFIGKMNDYAALRPRQMDNSVFAKPSAKGLELLENIAEIEEIPFLIQYLKAFYPTSFESYIQALLKKCHKQEPTEDFLAWMIEIGGAFDLLRFATREWEAAAILIPKLMALNAYADFQWKEELHHIQSHPISREAAREILDRRDIRHATELPTDPQERMQLLIAAFIQVSTNAYDFRYLPLYLQNEPFIAEATFHYDPTILLEFELLRVDFRRVQRVYDSFLKYPKDMNIWHRKDGQILTLTIS